MNIVRILIVFYENANNCVHFCTPAFNQAQEYFTLRHRLVKHDEKPNKQYIIRINLLKEKNDGKILARET